MQQQFDLLILGGVVVDGTGMPCFAADVGITGGRIAAIGDLSTAQADRTIDAEGRFVAPGFVDVHTHFDVQIFRDPTCSDALKNGVTTVAMGNCGVGLAPCQPAFRERAMLLLEAVEQIPLATQRESLPWNWETLPEFFHALGATKKALNVMMYAPLALIQIYVMGLEAAKTRPATDAEIARMQQLIGEAMDAGAVGLSLCYMGENNNHVDCDGTPLPNDVLPMEQICEIASVLQERGDGIIQCLTGRGGLDRTTVMTELLAGQGRPVIHSWLSTGGADDVLAEGLSWHDKLNANGQSVLAQAFAGRSWTEFSISTAANFDLDPTWRELTFAGTDADRVEKLKDANFLSRLRQAYEPRKFEAMSASLEKAVLLSTGASHDYDEYLGKPLGQIAGELDMDIVDLYAAINIASHAQAVFKSNPMTADTGQIRRIFGHHNVIVGGSDGGAHIKSFIGSGWTTDLAVWLVRDEQIVSVEELHHSLSLMPARAVGLRDRGLLIEGMAADILIYDLDELYFDTSKYYVSYDLPDGDWRKRVNSGGFRWIIVNGRIVSESDEYTGENAGNFLSPEALPKRRSTDHIRAKSYELT